MNGLKRHSTVLLQVFALLAAAFAYATPPVGQPTPEGGLSGESGPLSWVVGADFQSYSYVMHGTWWGLAETSTPSFDPDRNYTELWLQPRVNAAYVIDIDSQIYAGISAGITRDIGDNAFDYRDQRASRIENAYVGYARGTSEGWHLDISAGSQPFILGTGMLLSVGAINGNEWGSAASVKRVAWQESALARVGRGNVTGQLFWLEPNEVPSLGSKTRIAGASLEWVDTEKGQAGVAYIHVPHSEYFYPGSFAPFAFIERGRDGLTAYHGWSELNGPFGMPDAFALRAEFAIETGSVERITGRNDDLEAYAGYVGASYWFQQAPFAPKLTYGYAYFSGDDPDTKTYERFDPLYWGNGLDNWWFGANGAYAYINSNLAFQRVTLDGFLSTQDLFKLQYVRASAVEQNSPIQFGQAVRFDPNSVVPVVGVTDRRLSHEFMLQYVHVFTPTLVFSSYISRCVPDNGIDRLAPSGSDAWTIVGIGISVSL